MRLLSILLLILLPWLACVPASSPTTQTDGGALSAAEQITAEIGAACPSLAAFVPAAPAIGAAILVCEGAAGLAATIEDVLALFGVRATVAGPLVPLVPLVFDGHLVGYFPRSHADAAMTPAIAAEIRRRRALVADGGAR